MTYNPTTGKVAEISATQHYFAYLAELDNEELKNTIEVETLSVEFKTVGPGLGCGFTNTNAFKIMKYQEAVDRPDGKGQREEIVNKHN